MKKHKMVKNNISYDEAGVCAKVKFKCYVLIEGQ